MTEPGERFVELSAGRTRISIRGSGPGVIWTHGMLFPMDVEDATPLSRWFDRLHGYTVVRYDTRAHGRSGVGANADDHTTAGLARDLLEVADVVGFDSFIGAGLSMGSSATLHATQLAPDRFEQLWLMAPPTAWQSRPAQVEVYRQLKRILETHGSVGLQSTLRVGMRLRPLVPGFEAANDAVVAEVARAGVAALAALLEGSVRSDLPSEELISAVEIPTEILAVADDPGHPAATARRIADLMPHCRLTIVDKLDETALATWPGPSRT